MAAVRIFLWPADANLVGDAVGTRPQLKTIPAMGSVTLDGIPVTGANVIFFPVNPESKPCGGTTDALGMFQLRTTVGVSTMANGALEGDYIVVVTGATGVGLPRVYEDLHSSPLHSKVVAGQPNDFQLDLKSYDDRPPALREIREATPPVR